MHSLKLLSLLRIIVLLWLAAQGDFVLAQRAEQPPKPTTTSEQHYKLGLAALQRNNPAQAVALLRAAIKLQPDFAETHNTLGNALRQKGDLTAARAEFAETARLNQLKANNQAATFDTNTGIQKMKQGNLAAAISLFESAIRKDANYAPAHYQLGLALRKKGDRKGSAAAFERARQLDRRLKAPTP